MANFVVDQQQLGQLLHLLQMAQSQDTSAQSEVFHALKSIEERPICYLYLAFILSNQTFPLPLRTMAGLTLSSFLKRNKRAVHFEPSQLNQMKALLLAKRGSDLDRVRSMVISEMISRHDFDFQLFGELVQGVQVCRENVAMVNIILEDIRLNNENYNIFEDGRFWQVTEMLYQKVMPLMQKELLIANTSTYLKDYIKGVNLLTFHCPKRLYPYLTNYINLVIKPVLQQANNPVFPPQIVQLCLQGINQIIATKFGLVPQDLLWTIVNFSGIGESQKIWSNIMIDMIENQTDGNGQFQHYLSVILPKAVEGLAFTPQDQRNIKQEMEVEYNPYGEGDSPQEEQEDEAQILEASYGSTSGYTLRKLSFQLIQKISIHYSQGLWSQWAHFIGTRLRSESPAITQTAISFIGIIAQTCMYDMGEDLQQSVLFLLEKASQRNCTLVRATSLWALEKLLPAYKDYENIVGQCLGLVFEGVQGHSTEGTHTTHLMLKEAAISLLDQILSLQNIPKVVTPQVLQQIINTLLLGLNVFKGRALFSIFKAISTIFQGQYFRSVLPQATCTRIVGELCRKWTISLKSDSIVCPLLECLITAYEGMQAYLSKFNNQFFAQLILLLGNKERKQLVLRCIDFLSSIITTGNSNLHQSVTNNQFIDLVSTLAVSEDKEIRHFVYILISDIGKNYDISSRVEQLVLLVAQSMDQKSLTSRNNAFMCLTDLLERYPILAQKYLPQVFSQLTAITKTEQQMNHVYAFNFARMLGRLSLLDPHQGKGQILLSPSLVNFIFLSLRTRQVTKLTSDSFRGMLAVLNLLSIQQMRPIIKDLECVLQALVCYPVRRQENAQNQAIVMIFSQFTKQLRVKLGEQLWSQILQRPIFLPAAIRTLNSWCI